jgi:hypothetical protein
MELEDGHGDGGDQKMIICASTWKRKKEKNKMGSRQRYI